MIAAWIVRPDNLPAGYRLAKLRSSVGEMERTRVLAVAALVGERAALAVCRQLGSYRLDPALSQEAALAGAKLGQEGEFPALDRARWADDWGAETGGDGEGICALALTRQEEKAFRDFLAGSPGPPATFAEFLETARHFFFAPLSVAVKVHAPALDTPPGPVKI